MTALQHDRTGRIIFQPDPDEPAKIAAAEALKASHLARLDTVLAGELLITLRNEAQRLRNRIARMDPRFDRGMLGENGLAPNVDSVCRDAARMQKDHGLLTAANVAEDEVERIISQARAA